MKTAISMPDEVSQVLTVDRGRLTQKAGQLPSQLVAQMDDGLRLALDL